MADVSPATSTAGDQTHILIHELGHNLGMADLYDASQGFPAEINARHPFALDLMATTGNVPRLSLGHLVGLARSRTTGCGRSTSPRWSSVTR